MNDISLSRDIQDLYLELLLADNNEADSLSAALQKLAIVVQNAHTAGALSIAATTSKLIDSVDAVRSQIPPQEAVPLLLEGLKTLEAELTAGQANTAAASQVESRPAAESSNSLADDPELLQDFVLEAREHLAVVETQLLVLEQNPLESEPTHACFRAIHTIKGIAGFLELNDIREVSHEGETLLDNLRNGVLSVTPALIDVLLRTADFLKQEVTAVEARLAGQPRQAQTDHQELLQSLRDAKTPRQEPPLSPDGPLNPEPAVVDPSSSLFPLESSETPPELPATPIAQSPATVVTGPAPEAKPLLAPALDLAPPKKSVDAKKTTEAKAQVVSRSVKVDMEKLDYLADSTLR